MKAVVEKELTGSRVRVLTRVTYTCGHWALFRSSPPKVGEINTCLTCIKEVTAVAVKNVRVDVPPDTQESDWDSFY